MKDSHAASIWERWPWQWIGAVVGVVGALGDVGVVLLAALPFWGCGMWTSTLLAWTMGMRLTRAIWFLAAGGLIGLSALVALELGIKSLIV